MPSIYKRALIELAGFLLASATLSGGVLLAAYLSDGQLMKNYSAEYEGGHRERTSEQPR